MAALRLPNLRRPSSCLWVWAALSFAAAGVASVASGDAQGACLLQTKHGKARSLGELSKLEASERLEGGASSAVLLGGNSSSFGPDSCVTLSNTSDGTCKITTRCTGKDLSDTDFSFVCINPDNSQPYTLHSYGRGGFDQQESFDTGIECRRCATLSGAFNMHATTDTGPSSIKAPHMSSKTTTSTTALETAYFGPAGCFQTYLSQTGTCIVRTKCNYTDTSKFNPGITCTDKAGGYTRYYMGLSSFDDEEVFDTTLKCERCQGVDDNQGLEVTGILPKRMIEQLEVVTSAVINLTKEVKMLKSEAQNSSKLANATNSSKALNGTSATTALANGTDRANATMANATQGSSKQVNQSTQSEQSATSEVKHEEKSSTQGATAESNASAEANASNNNTMAHQIETSAKGTDDDDVVADAGAHATGEQDDYVTDADEVTNLVAMEASPKKLRDLLQQLAQ